MPAATTTATIYRNNEVLDFSVPVGTTVRGMLLKLDRGHERYRLCDELGRTLGETETFGQSLPAGIVLYTARRDEADASQRVAEDIKAANAQRHVPNHLLASILLLTCLSPVVALLLPGTRDYWSADYWPRFGLALALVAAFAVLVAQKFTIRTSWAGLVTPLPAAAAAGVAVMHPTLIAGWSYALAFLWGGTVAAFITRFVQEHDYTDTAVRMWLGSATVLSTVSLAQVPNDVAGPIGLAAAIVLLSMSASSSLRVPESQLLNLPAVLSTAPSVHTPDVPPPARITSRRVRHTLQQGSTLRIISISVACVLAIVSMPPVIEIIARQTLEGWTALALAVATIACFTLYPRDARNAFTRWVPRLVVMVLLGIAIATHPVGDVSLWIIGAIVLAAAMFGIGFWLNHGMYAPAITRAADILEQLAIVAAIPLALVAAGAFSAVRAMM
ncbi:hypothetical protein [Gulosibacter bifidus]|uniref:EccD-like transmembrane domain-containing protein n=1 Tax=Gulosibacter bifidus TaxID=272239 RepID=A0ABW5RIQ9_9MICO|nr:hypothetical protein [Gulosibacter bifidus]